MVLGQLVELVVIHKLLDRYGSERRSVVDLDPELCDSFLGVLPCREIDYRANRLSAIDSAATFLGVETEFPQIGLTLAFPQCQGTSLVSVALSCGVFSLESALMADEEFTSLPGKVNS